MHPGGEATVSAKLPDRFQGLQIRLLDDVLGILVAADQPLRQPVDGVHAGRRQLPERLPVSLLRPLQQGGFFFK